MFSDLNSLSFVQGASWDLHRTVEGQGRKRFAPLCRAASGQPVADSKAEAKKLTVAVKRTSSAKKLMGILDGAVDRPVFDFIMASAAYTQLVTLKRRRVLQQSDWDSPVLLQLHGNVQEMALENRLNAQATANILWSLAQLSDRFSIPTQLLDALVKSVPNKVGGMDGQGLSNSLWACVKLKDAMPFVMEAMPTIATQIPKTSKDMVPQALSNCLWACLQIESEVPAVLEIVPAIVAEIPDKIKDMNPHDIFNSLDTLVLLEESVPEVADFLADDGSKDGIVRSAATRLNLLLPGLTGRLLNVAVPAVVWACAKVGVYHDELLASVVERLGSQTKVSRLQDFGLSALSWSYQVLDADDDFADFGKLLKSEISRRGLSEADVQSSQLGYLKWNRAKV